MIACTPRARAIALPRAAFTLIELLVVISIIAILAALSLGVMSSAREIAREARTEALIAKINVVIQERYDSYRTRRVPLNLQGLTPRSAGERRLAALRDIMRMEMPENWDEVTSGPMDFNVAVYAWRYPRPGSTWSLQQPALHQAYYRRLTAAQTKVTADNPTWTPGQVTALINQNESAECLYLIVTLGSRDARETFRDNEIADTDGDGLFEFIDGWGNPIKFIRWAPGICDSGIQEVVATPAAGMIEADMITAIQNDYDPFDILHMDEETTSGASPPVRSWRLLPLIYSAGPDGKYDIQEWRDFVAANPGAVPLSTPYFFADSSSSYISNSIGVADDLGGYSATEGAYTTDGSLNHYDNIHNHRVEAN